MALTQNDYTQGGYYETDEERRRRLEQEAAAAGKSTSIFDIPGQMLDRRLTDVQTRMDNISQFATDPEAAIRQRMLDEKPTPVKQTITTDPETGAQTMKLEGSVQDLTSANPMTPTVTGPVVPMGQGGAGKPGETAMGGTEPTPDQTEQQRRADGLRAMMSGAGTQVAGPVPTPAAAPAAAVPVAPTQTFAENVAANQAAQPRLAAPAAPASVVPVNPVTQITPTGAPMVAAPAPAPSLAQAGAQATVDSTQSATPPVVAAAPWIAAANEAGGDFNKLLDVAAKFPESRGAIQNQLKTSFSNQTKSDEANKIIAAAQNGDSKALNKIEQAIRPSTGKEKDEITAKDYLQAYLYKRLGLDDLANNVQQKILGQNVKFGQIQFGGSNWTAEYDKNTGELIRARDDEGTVATPATLNKLSAAAIKSSAAQTHTGKMQDVTTGEVFYERTTPNGIELIDPAGKRYTGSSANLRPFGIGSDISTKNQIQLNELQNRLAYAGPTASAAEREKVIAESEAKFGPLADAYKAAVRAGQPMPTGSVMSYPAAAAPAAAVTTPTTAAPAAAAAPRVAATTTTPVATVGTGTAGPAQRELNLSIAKSAAEAEIQRKKELAVAEGKPPAEAKGKNVAKDINNQNFADQTYDLIQPIADIIKQSTGSGLGTKVDTLAAFFGKGTEGANAIAKLDPLIYPILANVPRFEGAQSEYDVKTYQKAAGDFADSSKPIATRLAALQGIVTLLKKYDKENKHDWSFSGVAAGTEQTINGVTYVHDGRGWKKK